MSAFFQRLLTALLAVVLLFAGLAPASAIEFGGRTGGTGEDVGGGSTGGTTGPGKFVPDLGNLGSVEDVPWNVPGWMYFRYTDTKGCEPGAIKKYDWMNRAIVGGRVVDTYGHTACLYAQDKVRELYKNLCVNNNQIVITQLSGKGGVLKKETLKTVWGKGNNTVAGCDASNKSNLKASTVLPGPGHYRAKGETTLDHMYVERSLNADPITGKIPPLKVLEWGFHKKVGQFNKVGTLRCEDPRWVNYLTDFEDDGCAPNTTPKTPPPPGEIPPPDKSTSYQCVVPGGASLDGKTNPIVDVMRDGKEHTLKWATPRLEGDVEDVKGISTRFEVWNQPELYGKWNGGNTMELKVGGQHVIPTWQLFKANKDGLAETTTVPGIRTGAKWKVFQSTARGKAVQFVPVWKFEAKVSTPSAEVSFDPMTGEESTKNVMVKKRGTVECRGAAITSNVMKVMNDQF